MELLFTRLLFMSITISVAGCLTIASEYKQWFYLFGPICFVGCLIAASVMSSNKKPEIKAIGHVNITEHVAVLEGMDFLKAKDPTSVMMDTIGDGVSLHIEDNIFTSKIVFSGDIKLFTGEIIGGDMFIKIDNIEYFRHNTLDAVGCESITMR